jgi:hypothetical protein
MTDSNYVHLILVVDRSGSMDKIASDAEGGIASFLKEQKAAAKKLDQRVTVTLVQFDSVYEVVYAHKNITSVPAYYLVPRWSTALFDVIGRTIHSEGEWLRQLPEEARPGQVFFVINTDGLENTSREFTKSMVRDLITKQTSKYSWNFVYLGANQDAITVGADMGISSDQSLTYTASAHGITQSYNSLSNSISSSRAAFAGSGVAVASAGFSEADRLASV